MDDTFVLNVVAFVRKELPMPLSMHSIPRDMLLNVVKDPKETFDLEDLLQVCKTIYDKAVPSEWLAFALDVAETMVSRRGTFVENTKEARGLSPIVIAYNYPLAVCA